MCWAVIRFDTKLKPINHLLIYIVRGSTMKTATLSASWEPRDDFKLGLKDVEGEMTYLGSRVWRNPHIDMVEKEEPKPGPTEVLLEL